MEKEIISYLLKEYTILSERINRQYRLIILTNISILILAIGLITHLIK